MCKNLGAEILLDIYNEVWKKEQLLKDWEMALIVTLHKKGDKKDCNYRGITLLSTAIKLFKQLMD